MADENPNARLLALSDGVIAVAITLLVLDIRPPDGFGEMNDAQLWAALLALGPRIFAYLLSFMVIASFWLSHRATFNRIDKTDSGLIWINMIFLLTVGLVPFTTNLIAESGGTLTTAIYAGTMMVSGLALAWMWGHARRNQLIDPSVTKEEFTQQLQRTVLIALVFAVSVPLSLTHSDFAKLFWLLIIPINIVFRWIGAQRWKREHPGEKLPKRTSNRNGKPTSPRD
jgi:uncharacterized membrane protein